MIVRSNSDTNCTSHVEFMSYTGSYPNLCSGILTVKIDGKIVKFGHDLSKYDCDTGKYKDNNEDKFWHSGGRCGRHGIEKDEWEIHEDEVQEKYRKYIVELDYVINSNIPFGCCGGCR